MPELNDSFAKRRNRETPLPLRKDPVHFNKHGNARANVESTARWQKLRRWFFVRNPNCCDPLNRHRFPEQAQEVHHVIPVHADESRAMDPSNLASLCRSCHRMIDIKEDRGEPTGHLFSVGNISSGF